MHPFVPISLALVVSYLWWKKRQALRGYSISLGHPKIPKFVTIKGDKMCLSKGDVYYTLTGDKKHKTIVFIHGIQTPSWVFQEYQNHFTERGFCVLSFDLYGRGFSSAPNVAYDDKLFVQQTEELVDALKIQKPFYLVGYSLGGAIATCYTVKNPKNVDKLCLIAPAGLMKLSTSQAIAWYFGQIPLITSYIFSFVARSSWLKKADVHFDLDEVEMKENSRNGMLFQYDNNPGFVYAVFSSMTTFPVDGLLKTYQELNNLQKDILLLWGETDSMVPFSCAQQMNKILTTSKLIVIKNKGHQIVTQRTSDCCLFIGDHINGIK